MKRVWITIALLACAGSLELGCKDACTSATERIAARYKACDLPPTAVAATGAETCTAAAGVYLDCRADCTESATCLALHGTDPQAAADYVKCSTDCK